MRHLVTRSVAVLLAAGAAITAQAAHLDNPNLLGDPSFEDPASLTADGPPFVGSYETFSLDGDQATGGDTVLHDTTMPRTGSGAVEIAIGSVANSFAGLFQDASFPSSLAGTQAWFSGWHKLQGNTGGTEARIEWRDSVNDVEISRTPNLTTSPAGSDYEEFIVSDTIPAGADTARLVYAIQSFGGVQDQTIFLDDVNFNISGYVPEPSAAMLALLGLAPLARRRR